MTTRRYLTTAAAPYTPATLKDTYNDSTLSTNVYELATAKAGANTALARAETSTTNNYKVLLGRWVSGPLTGGYTTAPGSDGITHTQARLESAAAANMTIRITAWVTVGDSDTVRGYLLNPFTGGTEFPTTLTNFSYSLTFDNAVAIQPGDRIVVELGYNAANTSATSYTGTIRAGGTAADLATTGTTGSTTNSPWMDFTGSAGFDAALVPYTPPASPTSIVGYASSTTTGSSTSITKAALEASLGKTLVDGDVLIVITNIDWGAMPDVESGWTPIAAVIPGSNVPQTRIQGKVAASEGTSWTFAVTTANNPDATVTLIALRGVDLATVIGSATQHESNGAATTLDSDSIDHAGLADSILLAGVWTDGPGSRTWTPPAGMTEFADVQSTSWTSSAAAYQVGSLFDPSGGKTFTPNTSGTNGYPWISWAVVLAPPSESTTDITKFFLSAA